MNMNMNMLTHATQPHRYIHLVVQKPYTYTAGEQNAVIHIPTVCTRRVRTQDEWMLPPPTRQQDAWMIPPRPMHSSTTTETETSTETSTGVMHPDRQPSHTVTESSHTPPTDEPTSPTPTPDTLPLTPTHAPPRTATLCGDRTTTTIILLTAIACPVTVLIAMLLTLAWNATTRPQQVPRGTNKPLPPNDNGMITRARFEWGPAPNALFLKAAAFALALIIQMLLARCGDIHPKPGPPPGFEVQALEAFPFVIATLNLQGRADESRLVEIAQHMEAQGIDVLCLQETRRDATDWVYCSTATSSYLFTCSPSINGNAGTGFIIRKDMNTLSLSLDPYVSKLSLLKKGIEIHCISTYLPTSSVKQDKRTERKNLQELVVESILRADSSVAHTAEPRNRRRFICGDFNVPNKDASISDYVTRIESSALVRDSWSHVRKKVDETKTWKRPGASVGWDQGHCLDRILYSQRRIGEVHDVNASFNEICGDHKIVVARCLIRFRPKKTTEGSNRNGVEQGPGQPDPNADELELAAWRLQTAIAAFPPPPKADLLAGPNAQYASELLPLIERKKELFRSLQATVANDPNLDQVRSEYKLIRNEVRVKCRKIRPRISELVVEQIKNLIDQDPPQPSAVFRLLRPLRKAVSDPWNQPRNPISAADRKAYVECETKWATNRRTLPDLTPPTANPLPKLHHPPTVQVPRRPPEPPPEHMPERTLEPTPEPTPIVVNVYCDGSCLHNGKTTARAAGAAIVRDANGIIPFCLAALVPPDLPQTNVQGEHVGLVLALRIIRDMIHGDPSLVQGATFAIYTDLEYNALVFPLLASGAANHNEILFEAHWLVRELQDVHITCTWLESHTKARDTHTLGNAAADDVVGQCVNDPDACALTLTAPPINPSNGAHLLDTPPTRAELTAAIGKLNRGRCPGADGLYAEQIKAGTNETGTFLHDLAALVWSEGKLPRSLRRAKLSLLRKREGGLRPITVGCLVRSILVNVILARAAALPLSECHFGFRARRGTTEAIRNLKNVMDTGRDCVLFLDLSRAYNSVSHRQLLSILPAYGFGKKMTRVIASALQQEPTLAGRKGESLPQLDVGLPQGCPLSPLLFVIMLDHLTRQAYPNRHLVSVFCYADDIALAAETPTQLEPFYNAFQHQLERYGLVVNTKKSKVLWRGGLRGGRCFMGFARVEHFVYLGLAISATRCDREAVKHNKQRAMGQVARLRDTTLSRGCHSDMQTAVTVLIVRAVLLYGLECCDASADFFASLRSAEYKVVRSALRINSRRTSTGGWIAPSYKDILLALRGRPDGRFGPVEEGANFTIAERRLRLHARMGLNRTRCKALSGHLPPWECSCAQAFLEMGIDAPERMPRGVIHSTVRQHLLKQPATHPQPTDRLDETPNQPAPRQPTPERLRQTLLHPLRDPMVQPTVSTDDQPHTPPTPRPLAQRNPTPRQQPLGFCPNIIPLIPMLRKRMRDAELEDPQRRAARTVPEISLSNPTRISLAPTPQTLEPQEPPDPEPPTEPEPPTDQTPPVYTSTDLNHPSGPSTPTPTSCQNDPSHPYRKRARSTDSLGPLEGTVEVENFIDISLIDIKPIEPPIVPPNPKCDPARPLPETEPKDPPHLTPEPRLSTKRLAVARHDTHQHHTRKRTRHTDDRIDDPNPPTRTRTEPRYGVQVDVLSRHNTQFFYGAHSRGLIQELRRNGRKDNTHP